MTESLAPDVQEAIETISKKTGMSEKETTEFAVSLLVWAISQISSGKIIAAADEAKKTYAELNLEPFKAFIPVEAPVTRISSQEVTRASLTVFTNENFSKTKG